MKKKKEKMYLGAQTCCLGPFPSSLPPYCCCHLSLLFIFVVHCSLSLSSFVFVVVVRCHCSLLFSVVVVTAFLHLPSSLAGGGEVVKCGGGVMRCHSSDQW
jgi:hypothetical protein